MQNSSKEKKARAAKKKSVESASYVVPAEELTVYKSTENAYLKHFESKWFVVDPAYGTSITYKIATAPMFNGQIVISHGDGANVEEPEDPSTSYASDITTKS